MPGFLLIGIPIIVAVLLIGILTLPDEENETVQKTTTSLKKKKKK